MSVRTRADQEGYIDVVVRGHGLGPGWHEARIEATGAGTVTTRILIVAPGPRLGIVSDIDDTAMVSHVPRMFVAAWNQLGRGRRTALILTCLLGGAALIVDGAPQPGGEQGDSVVRTGGGVRAVFFGQHIFKASPGEFGFVLFCCGVGGVGNCFCGERLVPVRHGFRLGR